jgi:disease resistance protein RPM1
LFYRYFIVIDDLWDTKAWDAIKCAFPQNNRGSRVITTTRIQSVAMACCSNSRQYIFNMEPLSEADSRRLFFGRIFGSEDSCPRQLQDISLEILKKCGGLPLAINSIASLLASEAIKKERWAHVRDSLSSIRGTNRTIEEMRQILNLSYSDLPHHLKTCLLYLGMYPEDHLIQTVDLALSGQAKVLLENGRDNLQRRLQEVT